VVRDFGLDPLSFAHRLRRVLQCFVCGLGTREGEVCHNTSLCSLARQPLEFVDLFSRRLVGLAGEQSPQDPFVSEGLVSSRVGEVRTLTAGKRVLASGFVALGRGCDELFGFFLLHVTPPGVSWLWRPLCGRVLPALGWDLLVFDPLHERGDREPNTAADADERNLTVGD
jgi:hypothetical protein